MPYPTLLERFLSYVRINTQSSESSTTQPSTPQQRDLAARLEKELHDLGLIDAHVTEWGYVLATLESNHKGKVPTVALIAHLDTSPDVSSAGVQPQLHHDYRGQDLVLSEADNIVLRVSENPVLKEKIGKTIITANGTTLLGADDKAGIAAIMDALTHFVTNADVPRPRVRVVFTPDEEVGRGVEHLTPGDVDADVGYTVDGEKLGEIEDETFCADTVEIKIIGKNVHPGYAKNKMVNAVKIAAALIGRLPADSLSPETTEKREGYVHPHLISGGVEEVTCKCLIRDFEESGLKQKESFLKQLLDEVLKGFPGARAEFKVSESYRNMKVILDQHPEVTAMAEKAVAMTGVQPKRNIIRGGTDGARLCFMGLPTPNIFTGGANFHSKLEWIALEDMQKASASLVNLVRLWAGPPQKKKSSR